MTSEAYMPLEKGGLNSRTLLLAWSATQRLPDESRATPPGEVSWLCVVAGRLVVNLDLPMTSEEFIPFENGSRNSRILLLPESTIHRLPEGSMVTSAG